MTTELSISPDDGQRLLRLARETIVAAVAGAAPAEPRPEDLTDGLQKPLGAFVTLYTLDELRGCIGRMAYDRPLFRNVIDSAQSSALHDPRFEPLREEEIPGLRIEVSVLNEPRPILTLDEFDVNQHGIVMEHGFLHGVFLPKVAREYGWDKPKTLSMLCRKVGLPEDGWLDSEARFKVFDALEFAEPPR